MSSGMDDWEDTVVTYCLALGLQFGFQTFCTRKPPSGTVDTAQWYPSTTFIATHTLTAALRDVFSRVATTAAPDAPPTLAALACAVRDLHTQIFQPYGTWLKATGLRPVNRPTRPLPNADSLHVELADLSMYWLTYSEAANLRHTPEMIWFIFFCAQRSWQAKQVLSHLRVHREALATLPQQPWLESLGPGLPRAIQELHARFRREAAGDRLLLEEEATLKMPPASERLPLSAASATVEDAAAVALYGDSAAAAIAAAAAAAAAEDRKSVRITVLADGSISMPCNNPYDKNTEAYDNRWSGSGSGSTGGSPSDDARTARDTEEHGETHGSSEHQAARHGRRRMGRHPESPSLPLPPSGAHHARSRSAFAVPEAAAGLGAALPSQSVSAPVLDCGLGLMGSTPMAPAWDPRVAAVDYRELLLRFCPNEEAVAAALAAGSGGGGGGEDNGGSTPFLTRVVQPLFLFLSEQVFELGQARRQGLESAVRICYDDVTESMAHPRIVAAALAALPWATTTAATVVAAGPPPPALAPGRAPGQKDQQQHASVGVREDQAQEQQQGQGQHGKQHVMPRAALYDEELYWSRLLALSDLPSSGTQRIPWQGDMAHYRPQLLRLLHGTPGGDAGPERPPLRSGAHSSLVTHPRSGGGGSGGGSGTFGDVEAPNLTAEQAAQAAAAVHSLGPGAAAELTSLRRANAAADWWARHVLRKTFVEHRSLAMPLLAFARVYQFQLCWFYLLCAWSWASSENLLHWVASAAALHWGSNCLLWTMQAVLSGGANMKRAGTVVPSYVTAQGRPRKLSGPSAPTSPHAGMWWAVQLVLLALCWGALAAGLYIGFIVWPKHDLYGYQCYPLFWERSCYWWIAVVYGGLVLVYELLYRQFNLGGYARSHLYDLLLRAAPGRGTATASSSSSPLYDPAVHLRTGLPYLLGNAALWGFALGLKFVIDYFVLVRPAGPRLADIMATDKLGWSFEIRWRWWPEGWARRYNVDLDPCMAAAQVIVLFLLSLVSSGVAYSVACAVWGAVQGVMQGIGSIRHWRHLRAGFHRVQDAMRAKLLSPEEPAAPESSSWALRAAAASFRAVGGGLMLPYTAVVAALRWAGCLPAPADGQPKSWEQREETLSITAPFWNAMVRSLRSRDLLSDKEASALSFSGVSMSPSSMMATWRRAGSNAAAEVRASLGGAAAGPRETYLPPVAVYVAQIPQLVISGGAASGEQLQVLQEAYLYLLHILVAVGAIPRSAAPAAPPPPPPRSGGASDATASSAAAAADAAAAYCPDLHKDNFHPDKFARMPARASSHRRLVARRELLGAVVGLVKALCDAGKAYKDTESALQPVGSGSSGSTGGTSVGGASAPAAATAAAAARGRAIDKLCMALHAVARCMTQLHDLPWSVAVIMNRVVVRQHYHQQPVKAQLDRGFSALVSANRNNATAWGAEHIPSYEDFAKVSNWLLAILRPSDEGTAPSNAEALSLLADFCSGLLHPGLPAAPTVASMRSVSTLIPHYQETVLYALSSADARRVLERAGAKGLEGSLTEDEILFKNDEGAPSELLQYLVSEFPDEFRNLLERCRTLVPLSKDEPPYVLEDFLPYGRLYEQRAQLLLWASFRGQVLARTVDGCCMYRTALALQAVQDAMRPALAAVGAVGAAAAGAPAPPQRGAQPAPAGAKAAGDGAAGAGRMRLSGVQRMMVRGILRDPSLCVEELVAQLADVVPWLGPLLERKYGLVLSSQVFAKLAGSSSLSDRWRAHGIALLATRYPSLRVAYLEQDGEPLTLFKAPDFTYRVVHQASVLVRAVPLEREVELRRRARAAKAAAAASVAAAAGTTATVLYDAGGALAATAASPPSVMASTSWIDGASLLGDDDGASSDDGDGDANGGGGCEEEEDAGAVLRVWRRRHLLKHLQASELEVLFRQQLPVNYYDTHASGVGVILGEGKPENQNSAVPYCPGLLLQTIDMNQDNSLAQAFKLRNVTREFEPLGPGRQKQQVAVVGYPEWIFSYRCGLLADLAAATERTFGTQIQRVMANPSACRSHYGHPDLWNRLFAMTRGGVSKANAVQHVSEDVFGGYNALKRGGVSKYVSYISVGKGRDMGLDSILGFEGKISKGCAEQLMSRDLRFLGCHTDFFRSMSLYFTVPGHFINTWLTVLTIRLGVWVQLLLLLGGVGKTAGSLASAMGAVQILQLGTMPLLGYIFNLWLESGLATALATLARQFVAGGLLFHIFRSTTSAFHLGRAVLFGGASYVATGRGFSLRRKTFTQVYVNYGRSHLYLGADILLMVVLILVAGNNGGNALPVPAAAMWSPLLVAAALLAGPFWFTPFFFRLNQVLRDSREFRSWIAGSAARGVPEGWPEWNAGQLTTLRDDTASQVPRYRFWSTAAIVLPRAAIASLSAIVAVTGARFEAPIGPDILWVLGGSVAAWSLLAAWAAARRAYLTSGLGVGWRWAKGLVQVVAVGLVAALAAVCLFAEKRGLRFSGVLITLYANYQVASLLVGIWVVWFPKTMLARSLSNAAFRTADAALGTALSACLILICFIGEIGLIMVDKVQTLVQFNDRYSHSQAARPYAGDDDPAVSATGGGGGGGGGGLAAAAAAALRRRLPSPLITAMPPNGGVTGGGAAGVAAGGGGGALQRRGSEQPSVMQGWVSPRFRAGGSATPVLMFGSTNVGGVLAAGGFSGYSVASGGGAAVEVGAPSPRGPAPAAGSTSNSTAGTPRQAAAVASSTTQRQAPAAPTPTPRNSSRAVLRQESAPARGAAAAASSGGAAAAIISGPDRLADSVTKESSGGDSGDGGLLPAPTLSSKELSWNSSALPSIIRQASSRALGSGIGAGSSAAAAVPPVAERTPSRSILTNVAPAVATAPAAPRLPPWEGWHEVASAAAEAAVTRGAARPMSQTQPRAQLQQQQPQPPVQAVQDARSPFDRYPRVHAWGAMPHTTGAGAVGESTMSSSAADAATPASSSGSTAPPGRWASPPVGTPASRTAASPMRSRQLPRPASADPGSNLPAIRPSPRAWSAAPGGSSNGGGGRRSVRQSPERTGPRVSGGGAGGGMMPRARTSSGDGSYQTPAAAAVTDGALSAWLQPRSMPYGRVSGDGGGAGMGIGDGRV